MNATLCPDNPRHFDRKFRREGLLLVVKSAKGVVLLALGVGQFIALGFKLLTLFEFVPLPLVHAVDPCLDPQRILTRATIHVLVVCRF